MPTLRAFCFQGSAVRGDHQDGAEQSPASVSRARPSSSCALANRLTSALSTSTRGEGTPATGHGGLHGGLQGGMSTSSAALRRDVRGCDPVPGLGSQLPVIEIAAATAPDSIPAVAGHAVLAVQGPGSDEAAPPPARAGSASTSAVASSVMGVAFEDSPLGPEAQSSHRSSDNPARGGDSTGTGITNDAVAGAAGNGSRCWQKQQPAAVGGPQTAGGPAPARAPPINPADRAEADAPSHTGGSSSRQQQPGGRERMHASRYRELAVSEVVECAPHQILEGISLSQQRLGRGSFGTVLSGAYNELRCAVKVMVANNLDKSALRELLLAPAINHANLVQTYTSRCARLTHEFFDRLEGVHVEGTTAGSTRPPPPRDQRRPRMLQPIPLQSEDGFGDPGCGVVTGSDPYHVLHILLHDVVAKTEQFVVVIVQELCTKGTLHAAIRQGIFRPSATDPQWNVRLARRALLRTSLELARGLLHLHDTGLVHGDFKPANVLLASSRDDRRGFNAKVADFGLVHVLPQHASSLSTDSFASPAYMAPEAFLGKASKATDVYSFGVCLWELLCGRTPYSDAHGVRDLVADLAAGRAPALVWPDGAEMADGIIALGRRCMSQSPADRPDFKEVVEELIQIERIIRAEALVPALSARVAATAAMAAVTTHGQHAAGGRR